MALKSKAIQPVDPSKLYLYDLPMAAQLLSTNVWALRDEIKAGHLKYVQVGRKFLISPAAIEAFIRTKEQAA